MANYYASPAGASTNTGAIGSPWDLQTALNNGSQTSGDTLWLRDGTYTGKFSSTLAGGTVCSYTGEWAVIDGNQTFTLNGAINASTQTVILTSTAGLAGVTKFAIDNEMMQIDSYVGNTVTVNRGWDGTTAASHSNGATVKSAGNQLFISGQNTTYRNFEVKNSDTNRDCNGDGNGFPTIIRGSGVVQYTGSGNSYINLIVHDNLNGFFIGSSSSNTTIYGVLSYNNGMFNEPSGHGYYLENSAGYSRLHESMSLNSFNLGVQAYGVSGPYIGGDFQGSVAAGAGAPVSEYHYNMIFGPNSVASPTGVVNECHFYHPAGTASYSVKFGYGAGVTTGTVTNNYFVGSGTSFEAGTVTNLTFTGNTFQSSNTSDRYAQSQLLSYTWNNNTYYNTTAGTTARLARIGVGGLTFASWQSTMGFDATGSISGSAMSDTVVVRPNTYDVGRANIVIYAPSSPASINVNLSTSGLVDNQTYTIKNAFNYLGSNVATGTYSAASPTISLSLNSAASTAVATPTGMVSTPATTVPTFGVFIVVPGAADVSAPGTPTGVTVALRQTNSTTGSFLISWTLGSGTETSVTLLRIVGGVSTEIPLAADTVSYTDTGQTVGLSYTYAVKASNAAGDSAWSDTVQKVLTGLTTFGSPPSVG